MCSFQTSAQADFTENAKTVLESRLPRATSADLNHLNAKSRDKLLLGWKFLTQITYYGMLIVSRQEYRLNCPDATVYAPQRIQPDGTEGFGQVEIRPLDLRPRTVRPMSDCNYRRTTGTTDATVGVA